MTESSRRARSAASSLGRSLRLRVRERRLRNGLLVVACERRANPVVASMIWYRVGSRDEATGETGLSHFLEHMLFKGTRRIAKGEIDLITAQLGGTNNAFTDHDYTAYYFHFARDRWEAAFAIEAERMRACRLEPAEFESEKRVVLEELRMGDDDPWRELYDAAEAAAFQVHPYHHPVIGWKEELVALQHARMRAFYKQHYAPDRAAVVVAGDVRAEDVFAAAERHFGGLAAPRVARPDAPPEPEQRGERRFAIERDTSMRRLLVAWRGARCGEPRDFALDVLSALLTGGRSSRLYRRLVKGRRVATHAFAENDARREPGVFWAGIEVRDGVDAAAAERALFEELEAAGRGVVAPRELARAKRVILSGHAFSHEAASEIADRLGRAEVLGGWRYAERYIARIDAVTAADVAEAARSLDARRRTVGWSVPQGANGRRIATNGAATRAAGRRLIAPSPVARSTFRLPPRRGLAPVVRVPFTREVLDNGLVVLASRNAAAPTAAVLAYVEIGVACERESQAGLEHLTGVCLEEGTRRFSGDAIAQRIEEAGGFLTAGAGEVTANVLADNVGLAIETAASLLREPTFPADAVERRRDQQVSDLLADEDELRTRAFRKLREAIYGKHPLHRPGDGYLRTVRRLRRADAVEFHRRWYAPSRTILAVVGDVDPREIAALARKHFGGWRAQARPEPKPPEIALGAARSLRERVPREQVHLAIGHLGVRRMDPDFDALRVLDHVLGTGSGFTDRMSRRLRDQEGLAYTVSANVTGSAGREPGIFAAYMSTAPANARRARAGLLREMRRVVGEEPPTAEEVRTAKDYLIGSFPFTVERNGSRVQSLVQIERYGLGADYLERLPARIEAVTLADVRRAARARLHPERCVTVEVGPEK